MFSRRALRLSVSFSIRIYRFVLHSADLYMAAQLLRDFAIPFEWFTRLANVNTDFLASGHRFGSTGVERK